MARVRPRARQRAKISTTVAPETQAFLEGLVTSGQVRNLAEALDSLVRDRVDVERRAELDRRMAAYYAELGDEEVEDSRAWGEFGEAELGTEPA